MATETLRHEHKRAPSQSRLKAFMARATGNPRWMLMETLSRFVLVRNTVKLLQRKNDEQYDLSTSQLAPMDVDAFGAALGRDGICSGLQLSADTVDEILAFASRAHCFGDASPRFGFRYRDKACAEAQARRRFSLATYFLLDELQPVLARLRADPLLCAIAARYLHSRPLCTGTRLWWTFAAPAADYNASLTTSFFHYDKDDYACLRFFFYLTEVDDDHGPHVAVRGSHLNKPWSQLFSLGERSDAAILDFYGADNLVTVYGAPGLGYAEDPFCFHRATRPRLGDRLMLEIKYATRDYRIFKGPDRSSMIFLSPAATES